MYQRRRLNLTARCDPEGEERFTSGFSIVKIEALVLGLPPNLPGFLSGMWAPDTANLSLQDRVGEGVGDGG
jgi:cytosine/uracil/thiamine/allantoin permease